MKRSPISFVVEVLVALVAVVVSPVLDHPGATPSMSGLWPRSAYAQVPESGDKTLSPYFFIKSDDPAIDQLPLKSTSAVVSISGVISDVVVTQVYKNEGRKPIEAVYVFPASTRAAVYGMKMTIGERTITARIEKRAEARQAYERAREEGKSASLLEQERPNVFQMSVANILPGDEIRTELRYTELLAPTDGVYEFVYPTVVGPRYSNQPASEVPASGKWTPNPYLHSGESPSYTFNIKVGLAAGVPIQEMSCPSHKSAITYRDKTSAEIGLDPSEGHGGNRDFVLRYRLTGDKIESGLLLYEGESENFFLLMMQPPKRVSVSDVPPREYIFIVDVSGSMHGYPLDISKKLLKDLASGLRPKDMFNVLLFSGGSRLLSERSLPVSQENIRRAVELIDAQQGGGGTELLPALKRALTLPKVEGVSRTFVIATDGYVSVEPEVFDLMRRLVGNANFFPFGIGTSVNRHLMEGMARIGGGEPFIVTTPEEAPGTAEKFRRYIQYPLLTGARIDFGAFEASDVEPAGIPDLFAERPVVVFGKWKGKPQGTIALCGFRGEHKYEKKLDAAQVRPMAENSALRYLWARSRVTQLSDYNSLKSTDERIGQITELGLRYNLLTAHTSFVAIDSEVRRQGEKATTVTQPLPLPRGVSDYAVGGASRPMAKLRASSAPAPVPYMGPASSAGRTNTAVESKQEALDAAAPGDGTNKEDEAPSALTLRDLKVDGSLSKEAVRLSLEHHIPRLQQCFPKQGKGAGPVSVTLEWTIDAAGRVVKIHAASPDALPRAVLTCLRERIRKWTFPVPKDGKKTHVVVTLRLSL